jgi:hypothetical protein
MDEFFAYFQILGPLGCQGWVVIPQNVKKVKITAPYWGIVKSRKIGCFLLNVDVTKNDVCRVAECSTRAA